MKEKLSGDSRQEVTTRYLKALDHVTTVPESAFIEFPDDLRAKAKVRMTLALQSELSSLGAGKAAGKIISNSRELKVR